MKGVNVESPADISTGGSLGLQYHQWYRLPRDMTVRSVATLFGNTASNYVAFCKNDHEAGWINKLNSSSILVLGTDVTIWRNPFSAPTTIALPAAPTGTIPTASTAPTADIPLLLLTTLMTSMSYSATQYRMRSTTRSALTTARSTMSCSVSR
jgi:hypothetical protein